MNDHADDFEMRHIKRVFLRKPQWPLHKIIPEPISDYSYAEFVMNPGYDPRDHYGRNLGLPKVIVKLQS